jgi:hypothetical protein
MYLHRLFFIGSNSRKHTANTNKTNGKRRTSFYQQTTNPCNMAKNPIFAILWIALLFFLAWPVAGICAGIWLILQVSSFNTFYAYENFFS